MISHRFLPLVFVFNTATPRYLQLGCYLGVFTTGIMTPERADQVLVTGEDVIRVGGDIVWRQAASFSTGYTILCGCVCPLPFIRLQIRCANSFKVFSRNMEAVVLRVRTRTV